MSQAGSPRPDASSLAPSEAPAADLVARVLVEVGLAHLDRPFDYAVPEKWNGDIAAGVRVKVPFAGREVPGYVLEVIKAADSEVPASRLAPLRRVVSREVVLTSEVATLADAVVARYGGIRTDVLRLAIPPRHARTESQPSAVADPARVDLDLARAAWQGYSGGSAMIGHLADGGRPRAVCQVAPGDDWAALVAQAVAATVAAGKGAVVCVPDQRDCELLSRELDLVLGRGRHVSLLAEAGPAARYRDFLAVARGAIPVAIGPRAAAWAPVQRLGLVAMWDDGDDLYAEPRAPYPHTREVLLLRAHLSGAAALLTGHACSVEAQQLVATGWAKSLAASRLELRQRIAVAVAGDDDRRDPHAGGARVPRLAHDTIKWGLQQGPVLVQTPRSGYLPALACVDCRTPARCVSCSGPLRLGTATSPPQCRWCGTTYPRWRCATCGAAGLRAPVVGQDRTVEELGRTFAPAVVRHSGAGNILADVPDAPSLVVATPGAEPRADGGYAAVVLLDTWLTLARDDLRAGEEALRRWSNAAALARRGGRVVAVGDPHVPALQALVRWDPAGFAAREYAERDSAGLPPAARLAVISGPPAAVAGAAEFLAPGGQAPAGVTLLGPVPWEPSEVAGESGERHRLLVKVARVDGSRLVSALRALQRRRSADKLEPVRVQLDPWSL